MVQAKSVASAAHVKGMSTALLSDEATATAAEIQAASRSIMSQALLHLQQLNPTLPAEAAAGGSPGSSSSSKAQRKMHKAIRAAATGVYELLAALEAVQDCSSYLSALVEMSRQQTASVVRHALKLLAARLSKAEVDLADLEAAVEQLPAAARSAQVQQLAEAGLAICNELPRLMQSEQPMTRQLALVTGEAAVRKFGQLLPSTALSSLPVVLAAVQDGSGPVRVSALVCIATSAAVLGTKLVPRLPQTAAAVLTAAQDACRDLVGFNHQQHAQEAAHIDNDAAESDDDNAAAKSSGASSSGENAALQLAGALAALQAMVSSLAAFMSPYLKSVLQLLLHQQVLSCSTADAALIAQQIRTALPAKIPTRLLLEPVLLQWDYALAACGSGDSGRVSPAPVEALLELVAAMAASMEPSTAVTYHEQLLGVLLRALDTRHRWLLLSSSTNGQQQQVAVEPAAAGIADAVAAADAVQQLTVSDIHSIEQVAVKALAATVMKLSESKFKPFFLRMQDWATSSSSAADASSALSVGRAAAFLAAVNMFAHRLRAVFVPYYRYYSALLMKHLVDDIMAGSSGEKRAKKKRKSSAADTSAAAAASEGLLLSSWLARLRAVRAVHLLALHEAAAGSSASAVLQDQQERFERLLPLVVEQLATSPPAVVAAVLADEGADSVLDLPGGAVAALGPVGKAVVEAGGLAAVQVNVDLVGQAALGALLQMAVAGGSDITWKPLHHALLMATRGGSLRAKLLALGGVSRLVELLKEEYLMLLPEALPFLSELIEDGDVAVEGAAQGLVVQLEELSGEKLEQYLKA
jgi:U3 small nucleolar RNA-associated protein 10